MADVPARYRNAIVPHINVDGAAAGMEFYTWKEDVGLTDIERRGSELLSRR